MQGNFHLVLSVASLGLFFGAVVLAPRFGRSSAHGGSLDVLRVSPYQRRQQLLRTVEMVEIMYGSERGTQRRQQLLSTTSEVDRAMGDSEAGYIDSSQRLGRVKAIGNFASYSFLKQILAIKYMGGTAM